MWHEVLECSEHHATGRMKASISQERRVKKRVEYLMDKLTMTQRQTLSMTFYITNFVFQQSPLGAACNARLDKDLGRLSGWAF